MVTHTVLGSPSVVLTSRPANGLSIRANGTVTRLLDGLTGSNALIIVAARGLRLLRRCPKHIFEYRGRRVMRRVGWLTGGCVGILGFKKASMNSPRQVGSITGLVASKRHGVMILSTVSKAAGALIRVSSCLRGGGPSNTGRMVGHLRGGCGRRVGRLFSARRCHRGNVRLLGMHFRLLHSCAGSLFALFRRHVMLTRNRLLSAAVMGCCLRRRNIGSMLLPTLSFVHASGGTRPSLPCVGRHLTRRLRTGPSTRVCVARNFVYHGTCNRISGLRHNNDSCDTSLVNTTMGTSRVRV